VHYKFIAFNCLKVFENSSIWHPLQEDQDCSLPPSFDLEERTARSNAFPKAPSVKQENSQVSPGYPSVAYKALVGWVEGQGGVYYVYVASEQRLGSRNPNLQEEHQDLWGRRPPAVDGSHHRIERNLGSEFDHQTYGHVAVAILKRDSLTSYEAAMEDNRTDPEDESLMVPMTKQHIDDALLAVTNQIFPYHALKTQKEWMSKHARKPYEMGAKHFVISMSWINNYIPFFPNAAVLSKYSKEELLNILEFAVPPHWRKAFDLRDYLPTSYNKARFISECERVKWK
jgi:hypothetical protein